MSQTSLPNYEAWQIDAKDFPSNGSIENKIQFLCGYGILAPSTHNTQPWLFEVHGNRLVIILNRQKLLPVGDPNSWGAHLSLGACAENIVQAATVFGLKTTVHQEEEDIVISFEISSGSADKKILTAIKERHSDKLSYQAKLIPAQIKKDLEKQGGGGVHIRIVDDQVVKSEIVENHLRAAAAVAANPAFGRELASWLRSNGTKEYDGMPGFVAGNSKGKSAIGKALISKKPTLLKKFAAKDRSLFEASQIVVFTAPKKSQDGFAWGQTIERFWLAATRQGLVCHPMHASIQEAGAQKILADLLATDEMPVFLMRIGYSNNKLFHTPRGKNIMGLPSIAALSATLSSKPTAHQIAVGKYTINYVVAGQGSPLVLIHGANIGWPQWHLNLDALAKNHTVYALDLPGAGDSTKVNFRKMKFVDDYVDVVDAFIKQLGLKEFDLVGSSFGGWVAMKLAIMRRPYIKRLILTNPIGFTQHMPAKFRPISIWPLALMASKTALKPERNNKTLEKFMRDVFANKDIPLKKEFIDYFYELSKVSHNVLFISRLAYFSGMRKELFLGESLSKIKVPTLVIWGKLDPLMPYKTVKNNFQKIKNVQVALLEDVGHMPPVEAPAEFNKQVLTFLEEKAR